MEGCKSHDKALADIARFVGQVDFGEVIVTIHNGQVVQIEKREKKRYSRQ